jgi:hypothetical protein
VVFPVVCLTSRKGDAGTARKTYKPEAILAKLRPVDVLLSP